MLTVGASPARARAPSAAIILLWNDGSTATGRRPFLRQLLRKIEANEVLTTARNPKSARAQGACSRDDPQPKLSPATSTQALAASGRLSTKSGRGAPSSA